LTQESNVRFLDGSCGGILHKCVRPAETFTEYLDRKALILAEQKKIRKRERRESLGSTLLLPEMQEFHRSGYFDYHGKPEFASGRVWIGSVLDSLLARVFYLDGNTF